LFLSECVFSSQGVFFNGSKNILDTHQNGIEYDKNEVVVRFPSIRNAFCKSAGKKEDGLRCNLVSYRNLDWQLEELGNGLWMVTMRGDPKAL
jgi:hypothetical protein